MVTGLIGELANGALVGFTQLGRRKEIASQPTRLRDDVVRQYEAHNVITW